MAATLDSPNAVELNHKSPPAEPMAEGADERPSQHVTRDGYWIGKAPKSLRRGGVDAADAWSLYWRKRRRPPSVAELCRAKSAPLAWGLDRETASPMLTQWLGCLDKLAGGLKPEKFASGKRAAAVRKSLDQSLEEIRANSQSLDSALVCLAIAYFAGEAGSFLEPHEGWALVDFLWETAVDAQSWQASADSTAETALAQQLLAGELPLVLSYAFADMAPMDALRESARASLSTGIVELLDGKGLIRGSHRGVMRPLLASWTRSRALSRGWKRGTWSDEAQVQFEAAVRQAIRLTAPDGTALLSTQSRKRWLADFLRTAVSLGSERATAAAAQSLIGCTFKEKEARPSRRKHPKPSYHSEWAGLGVMRSAWSPAALTVAVDYSSPEMKMAVWADRRELFVGPWIAEPKVNGDLLAAAGQWQQLCWFSDADVDYLEFCMHLDGGARLERQVLLAKRDQFVLLADHLQCGEPAELELAVSVPMAAGVRFIGEEETRDGVIMAGKPIARVLPLALPEWRIDPRDGDLGEHDGTLTVRRKAHGRTLACPLFVDLAASRSRRPCTWRQLTVGESLALQSSDVAVAYRAQSGGQQWVFYRSQGRRGNRTFIGQNTSSEFVAARFLASSGEIEELVEIEG